MDFAHLHVHSYFSLLDGAASPDELVQAAWDASMSAVALTDHNSLAGAVRFYQAAIEVGVKPIIGVEFDVGTAGNSGAHLVLLAEDNEGYANLCRLVTAARLGEARRESAFSDKYAEVDRDRPLLSQEHLREHCSHLIALSGCQQRGEIPALLRRKRFREAHEVAGYYRDLFGSDRFFIELHNHLLPRPDNRMRSLLADLAGRLDLPVVATNNVHYARRSSYRLQDVLVCIRNHKTVEEFYLKSPRQMARLFRNQPEAIENAARIAERCNWSLDLETFHFPRFDLETATAKADRRDAENGGERHDYLRCLCEQGARRLYGNVTGEVRRRLEHELRVIEDKGLCDYFLIVWDIVRFAKSQGIACSGRGSAGDSIVSYTLGITGADPIAHDLLFERFLNPERRNMPDIDVDFCSRRRDEVTRYIYDKYGAERVAAVCTVNTFRARSAVREVGKALGFPEEELGRIASVFPHIRAADIGEAVEKYPEVRDAKLDLADKRLLIELCGEISGFPRHLSVHVGGLLIGARPLTDMVPLQLANKGIVIAQFDKDDVEALGLVKMDILALRIHTAIDDALDHIERRTGARPDLKSLPLNDAATYRLLRSTHTVGLFQLESPGQRSLLGRTQPDDFEGVVANISLFRPGPVQSDMIEPYIRRKRGLEPVRHIHPALARILDSSYGVVIYQEQVLRIAHEVAGMSLGEADGLRRMMTKGISEETMRALRERFISGAIEHGCEPRVAEQVFEMIVGFAAYGFNKAHAACFGMISYHSAYLKAHYPAELFAGILSSEPMGFYPPRTIAEEAKRCGVGILPPCVNVSESRCTVEYPGDRAAIRLGLGMVRGATGAGAARTLDAREQGGPFASLEDFRARVKLSRPVVENLIMARTFDFTGLEPQELLWRLGAHDAPEGFDFSAARRGSLDSMSEVGRVAQDLQILGVSTTVNPFAFWGERMREMGVTSSRDLYDCRDGDRVRVAGIVVARARPPTRSGRTAIFISLEDAEGLVDVAVFEDAYRRCGGALYTSPVLCVEGRLTRRGKLDLSVTARDVIGMGNWQDFEVAPGRRAGNGDGGRQRRRQTTETLRAQRNAENGYDLQGYGNSPAHRAFSTSQSGEKRQTVAP
jgi:error-prone DNA polymerase